MPFVCSCHKIHSVAHFGTEKNHLRLSVSCVCKLEGLEYALEIVAVGLDYLPSEGCPFVAEVFDCGDCRGRAVDLLAVPVGEGNQIVHLVVGSPHSGLPYLALLALSVAAEHIDAGVVTIHLLTEGNACRGGKSLSQRA